MEALFRPKRETQGEKERENMLHVYIKNFERNVDVLAYTYKW